MDEEVKLCCAYNCGNTSERNHDLVFFTLPPDPNRCYVWLKLINREDIMDDVGSIMSYNVCEAHFQKQFILVNGKRKRLSKFANPTQNVSKMKTIAKYVQTENGIKAFADRETQTDEDIYADCSLISGEVPISKYTTLKYSKCNIDKRNEDRERIRELERRLSEHSRRPSENIEDYLKLSEHFLSDNFCNVVRRQAKLQGERGVKNDEEFKRFCRSLHRTSITAYKLLKDVMSLPDESTFSNTDNENDKSFDVNDTDLDNIMSQDRDRDIGDVPLENAVEEDCFSHQRSELKQLNEFGQ